MLYKKLFSLAALVIIMTTSAPVMTVAAPNLTETKLVPSDLTASDLFGSSVAINETNSVMVVGARQAGDDYSGAVYIYVFNTQTSTWEMKQKLLAFDDGQFGTSVAITKTNIIIGDPYANNGTNKGGAVYSYRYDIRSKTWVLAQKITPTDITNDTRFGYSLDVQGNQMIVGGNPSYQSGVAYIYTYDVMTQTWKQQAKLSDPNGSGEINNDFGRAVAIDTMTAVVGDYTEDERGNSAGAAYVYTRNADNQWILQNKFFGTDTVAGDLFGARVDINNNQMVVSAPQTDDASGNNKGTVYVFEKNNNQAWSEVAQVGSPEQQTYDGFGETGVAILNNRLLVANAGHDDSTYGVDSGAVYIYDFYSDTSTWVLTQKLVATDSNSGLDFGSAVALTNSALVVGAYGDDTYGSLAGATYFYR